jgi:23S rRNA (adenine1618-N6)-methyltransferase
MLSCTNFRTFSFLYFFSSCRKGPIDFVMCNPPVYETWEAVAAHSSTKHEYANTVCTGNDNEMCCPGGEIEFVCRIMTESYDLRNRIRLASFLIGEES